MMCHLHVVTCLLIVSWIFVLDVYVTKTVIPICFTWNNTSRYLTVECTVYVATNTNEILIFDSFGKSRGHCTLGNYPGCAGNHRDDVLHVENTQNITTMRIKTAKHDTEGEWKCRYGLEEKTLNISYTEGSNSANDVEISGEMRKTIERNEFKIECFSCWKPYIEGVDIYVNGVLEDSIRYHNGLCYHKKNLCYSGKCTCLSRGKHFTWHFKSDLSYIQFTCAMRFENSIKSTISIHKASMIYNGKVFTQKQTTSKSIDHLDKTPRNINTDTEKTNSSGYIGESVLGTVGLIVLVLLVICFWQICNWRKKQAKENKSKSQELVRLQDNKMMDNALDPTVTPQEKTFVRSLRKLFDSVSAEKNIDKLSIFSNAHEELKNFGFEVLRGLGVEVEQDRVSFYMNKLQQIDHIVLHELTACLFQGRSFRFLRLYEVMNFDLSSLHLSENMYNELKKIFKTVIDKKGEKLWYHYRRNGLTCKGSGEGAFSLLKQVFRIREDSDIFQHFSHYESRLETFKDYPMENKQYRENLASAGFFYFHVSDYVQCFACGGCLRNWKYTIDPMRRHIETFHTCHYAIDCNDRERSTGSNAKPGQNDSMPTNEDRLNSFKTFPDTASKDELQQLAIAGFYYCGIAKDIVCCACNIGFSNIEQSDRILRLHKQYSPDCPNIGICDKQSQRKDNIDKESISFAQYLELEYRSHDFGFQNI